MLNQKNCMIREKNKLIEIGEIIDGVVFSSWQDYKVFDEGEK